MIHDMLTSGQVGFKALQVHAGEDVSHTVGNTCETQEQEPGDADRLGTVYLHARDRGSCRGGNQRRQSFRAELGDGPSLEQDEEPEETKRVT